MIGCLPTQALAFLAVFVYATHSTQAIAFEWKPGLSVPCVFESRYGPVALPMHLHQGKRVVLATRINRQITSERRIVRAKLVRQKPITSLIIGLRRISSSVVAQ